MPPPPGRSSSSCPYWSSSTLSSSARPCICCLGSSRATLPPPGRKRSPEFVSENLRRARSALEQGSEIDNFTEQLLTWAGACTIFFVGSIHVLISGEHFIGAPYLGALFVV